MESLIRDGAAPFVIAHRGASGREPENTLPAFHAAWLTGAGWIEADVQPSADGVPVIFHDDLLDRTTNATGPLRRLTAAQIARLDAGSWFKATHRCADSQRPRAVATGQSADPTACRTGVPTLAALLDTLAADRSLLLEIKGPHTHDQVAGEIDAVMASGWSEQVLLHSFQLAALHAVRTIQPDRAVGVLVEELHGDPISVSRRLGAVAYNPEHTLLRRRPEIAAELHRAGIAVFVWTADDPDDWRFLTDIGVDGIITNNPGELLAWQQSNR
jgi:glycerophosphoryl diester phosphodiesterase